MDAKQPKPLTDEERQAVEKAMQEFASGSRNDYIRKAPVHKQKSHNNPFPIWAILIPAAVVILILGIFFCFPPSGNNAPTESTPAFGETYETQTSGTEEWITPTTQQTEAPTAPVPPTTQATEVTEPPTQPTNPATQPTEPPVKAPEGTPLNSDELWALQLLFHEDSVYAYLCSFTFSDPRELDFRDLINIDFSSYGYHALSSQERNYLTGISEEYSYRAVSKMTRPNAIATLEQYYGLTIDDVPSAKNTPYWASTNSYYFFSGSRYVNMIVLDQAVCLDNGMIWVHCINFSKDTTNEMILKPVSTGYHILSNQVIK